MRLLPAFLAAILLLPLASGYPDPDEVPRYYDSKCYQAYDRRFVHDYLGALEPEMAAAVEGAACEVYANTSAHFVFVSVESTDGEALEPYALHLFERWGVGDKERLDGVMLLYVRDYALEGAGSAVRLEVGYGLTGVLDGITSHQIVREMRDAKQRAIDAGDDEDAAISYALGFGAFLVLALLDDQYVDGAFPKPVGGLAGTIRAVPPWAWVVGFILLVSIVSALSRSARRRGGSGWGYYPGSPQWSSGLGSIFASQMMRGGRGGGGFGGGGGGFGGGRSGGGGGSGGF